MVDLKKLISLVSEKKTLWDTKDKLYHNRDIAKSCGMKQPQTWDVEVSRNI